MATTRGDAVLDALKTKFDAASGLANVTVKDGPYVDLTHDKDVVLVGHDGAEDDSSGVAVTTETDWVGVGTNNRRDERIDVTCAALTWIGDNDSTATATSRTRVYELVDACEAAILADVTLGVGTPGTPGAVRNAFVSRTELHQSNNAGGAKARVVFTVTCIARL